MAEKATTTAQKTVTAPSGASEDKQPAQTAKAAAGRSSVPHEALSLRQKIVEMRKALLTIKKEHHSDGVKYAYSKVDAIWGPIRPVMDELGVLFEFVGETPTRTDANGSPSYWQTMTTDTRNGSKLMFFYESDLRYRWINTDNEDEVVDVTLHALGWNDDPAKAKGAARTYAEKYYLWDLFSVDQGEDDPDNNDFGATGKRGNSNGGQRPGGSPQQQGPRKLSEAQMARLYKKGEAAGFAKERVDHRIATKYQKTDPTTLTRQEYDEICEALDTAAAAPADGGATNA